MEEWRDIEGYEKLYQVSSEGRVRSLDREVKKLDVSKTLKGKILKQYQNNSGYLLVVVCKNGKPKTLSTHRLVAQAFIPNPDNLPECNHLNECKTDNRVENLEWCDREYNINYGTAIQRMVDKRFNK